MSGTKYILDTNVLISFFKGNSTLKYIISEPVGVSIISILEFLSFSGINETARKLLFGFVEKIEVFELKKDDIELINIISELRIKFKIKLPDAIISGTAIYNNAILITTDKGFSKIPLLQTVSF
ncbi:MAG TPA: PIN domain-containing protein [Segetibacter sp.]